jgi:hypothetical protein
VAEEELLELLEELAGAEVEAGVLEDGVLGGATVEEDEVSTNSAGATVGVGAWVVVEVVLDRLAQASTAGAASAYL